MELIRTPSICKATPNSTNAVQENVPLEQQERHGGHASVTNIDIDLREVYFLMLHFLSTGPCKRTFEHLRDELLENHLLPRRYHSWCSRSGECSGHSDDDGISFPLSYDNLIERYPHIEKDHLVKLLKQLIIHLSSPLHGRVEGNAPNAADVPTLLGSGSFSLLDCDKSMEYQQARSVASYLRWPHMHSDQLHGLSLREIGGGFTKHHRAPSSRSACYAIAKPSTMVQKMQNIKKLRGHRNAVYCAIFDRSGRYVITGSDDRLVKIWSMETAFCLASCRGHEGDITDLAVSSNNALVASASNDFVIRVWRLPDGMPISVLRGHTGAVTAIAFSPRPASVYQLLSSSDDGTCRIWDARYSQCIPRIYVPSPLDAITGKSPFPSNSVASTSNTSQSHQILCCAYNANGTVFVTGSSDSNARVWSALKPNADDTEQPIHELDVLRGHENDVNYVQFSGCAVAPRSSVSDSLKEDIFPKFKNSWFCHDNIVTCSRDGSAIIWTPRSRKSHGKSGRWTKAYHLKVPPPPLPPKPPRGGPRQRFLPTPRGVNMIIWSLDNRFVLAAIMDCRICVWNASDGSLVHCLTGHTESSYVLDVHPFNPRIAMSAGYDGRTIIWDIWEGVPIKIYEIGRFKLVDGKFSQDGTSIVLSDEVGQIYFLNTGQGESQKDAKYDQFFLGDYRPLIRDTNGNVLDQETQLVPHRRNLQDLLCDSSMIPYPEPYQTMYQQRRLGGLGVEWHPSSMKFAVGPDFSLGQDYIMPPLADLDRMIEPLPDFIDAMYWEPENEVMSEDNDSEYNAEECSADGARVSLCYSSSSELDCSSEDSDVEHIPDDSHHRQSRRKQHRVEPATSTGRRVKKRILDENEGAVTASKRTKNARSVLKASKRKSSDAKALRPQRVAARNARSLLSKISGSSSDGGYEDDLSDSSDSESISPNPQIQGSESDRSFLTVQRMANSSEMPESQWNNKQKKKLILKISVKKPVETEGSKLDVNSQADLEQLSLKPSEENHKVSAMNVCSREPGSSSANASSTLWARDMHGFMDTNQQEKAESKLDESFSQKGELPFNDSTEFTACGVNEEGQTDFSRDGDQPRPEALSGWLINGPDDICNSEETKEIPPKKIRKLRLKLRQPRSPLEQEPAGAADDFEDGVGNFAVESASMNQIIGSGMTQDSEASESELMMRENMYDVVESPAARFEYGEPATDEIRRKRSMKMKATSSESNIKNNKLRVRFGHGSAETLKKQDSRSPRVYDHTPLEEWPSSSKSGVRSRNERSSQSTSFASKKGLPVVNKVNNVRKKLSWLTLSEEEEGFRYIPQLGDEVVYFKQGHQEFLESRDSTNRDRSRLVPRHLKAVEICKVEKLDYDTYPGSGESCCKLTLRLLDPPACVSRQEFQLTLPDLIDFPDFIVEKARYDAAIKRHWGIGDKCLVWWRNESGEDGAWWEGIIHYSRAKSDEFPDSPWERYEVHYDTGDVSLHSPWEFYDPHFPWENSGIDEEIRDKLLSGFARLEKSVSRHQDNYGIQKLNEVAHKMDFCNRFPVPLYPELIRERLEKQYYRSIEAFKHDVDVMLSNTESYFARNKQVLSKTRRLQDWFTRMLNKVLEC